MEITAAQVARDLTVLAAEGTALAELAATAWDEPVPACPGWDVGAVLVHVGGVHRWATANVSTGQRTRRRDIAPPPAGRDAVVGWYDEGLAALVDVLAAADPYAEVWTFAASGEQRAGWWARRMAQETGVHRWDAADAAGPAPVGFEPSVAAAGIEEYLLDYLPRLPAERFDGLAGTLHIHSEDADGEWVLDLDDPTTPARREHAKSDTAVRGPATDLLLWLLNRQMATGHLTVFGDDAVVAGWRQLVF